MIPTAVFFDQLFANAKGNAIIILNNDGLILKVNEAFTHAYGYSNEELLSKHFRVLYPEKDQITRRPEIELNTAFRQGASSDENYLIHKDGTPIWVTGESILIKAENNNYVVKVIHNIHAQKQLERYLLDSDQLLDSLFDSIQHRGLLLLNTQMKTLRANKAFSQLFHLSEPIIKEGRLQQINHPFWSSEEIRNDVRNALVQGTVIQKEYIIDHGNHQFVRLHVTSKLVLSEATMDKKLLLIINEV
jgi:PAS domain S-box-containing protein